MRRVFRYLLMVSAMTMFTGCMIDDAEEHDTDALRRVVWNEAKSDMSHISELLTEIYYFDMVLSMEDSVEQESLFMRYFPGSTMINDGNSYVMTTQTAYGTTYTTTYTTDGGPLSQDGKWSVKRTGGNGFDLELRPTDGDSFVAEFKSMTIHESSGSAEFEVLFAGISESMYPMIQYNDGYVTMVDKLNSSSSPVTLTSSVVEPWLYQGEGYGFVQGVALIECHDALYGATDSILVHIDKGNVMIDYLP